MRKITKRRMRNVLLYGLTIVGILILTAGSAVADPVPIALEDIKVTGAVPLKLYVFECGTITIKDASMFDPYAEKGTEAESSSSCYLIQHPQGTLVWDTGISDAIAEMQEGAAIFDGAIHWFVPKTLKAQLDEIGVEPSTIDYLAFSHFHADHTGNPAYFSNATLLIQEVEYAQAFSPEAESYGFDPQSYANLQNHPTIMLHGHHDVFGDGTVVIISTPGHTVGHQVLWVDLPKTGPIILSGDLYMTQHMRENYTIPPFTADKRQVVKSFVLLDDLLERTGARLWLNHDKEQNDNIAHTPAFHE